MYLPGPFTPGPGTGVSVGVRKYPGIPTQESQPNNIDIVSGFITETETRGSGRQKLDVLSMPVTETGPLLLARKMKGTHCSGDDVPFPDIFCTRCYSHPRTRAVPGPLSTQLSFRHRHLGSSQWC
jgi:hypothetical protein